MKKLFFFRSHSSNNITDNQLSPPSTDKQVSWEKPKETVGKSPKTEHDTEDQGFPSSPSCLRRSLSTSGSPCDSRKGPRNNGDQTGSPYSNKQPGQQSSCSHTLHPERQTQRRCADAALVRHHVGVEKYNSAVSRAQSEMLEISSNCSSNVLDLYIDGEQQMEKCESKTNFSGSNQLENGNAVVKRPPRGKFSIPLSRDARNQKPKSQSFRETKTSRFHLSTKDGDNGDCIDSPRKLAKQVVKRLSQFESLPKIRSKEVHPDGPITIEDVYGGTSSRCSNASYIDGESPKKTDWNTDATFGSNEEILEFLQKDSSGEKDRVEHSATTDTDLELLKYFKEAEKQAAVLLEELQNGNFLQLTELSVPALIQTIISLTKEKLNMALEISSVLEDRIAEKAMSRETFKLGRIELEAGIQRLEKEKYELQLLLERELDRRSTEWSFKLEKYHTEEQRLRERVRELAEQNVSLQREVCSSSEREKDVVTRIANSEKQLEDMSIEVKEAKKENQYLHKTLTEMTEKSRVAAAERDCIRRNYEEKVTECKDMHQTIARLQRTSNDQEKTIAGLQELCEELGRKNSQEDSELGIQKLQTEYMRLTGVEHALRKEVEACQVQVNLLRQENTDLLNRLKNHGKEGGFSTFKLDQELQNRISCLQDQILPLLMESNQLGMKLLEFIKTNSGTLLKEATSETYLESQFLVECEVRIQGLQRAAENFASSTQIISGILQGKLALLTGKFHSISIDPPTQSIGDSCNQNKHKLEDITRSALKAEILVTNLLREKLYSKEQEIEQLQAELAAAVRGNDILKCEVQNAVDDMSCMNHKMKDFELQMMKKDETIDKLQGELQNCKKELAAVRGILPKVSEERDIMWEKVKQYSEDNMLLSGEINVLRKKIEVLDDDIMLKEGQISILKDSMSKPVDLLASPESPNKLMLERYT